MTPQNGHLPGLPLLLASSERPSMPARRLRRRLPPRPGHQSTPGWRQLAPRLLQRAHAPTGPEPQHAWQVALQQVQERQALSRPQVQERRALSPPQVQATRAGRVLQQQVLVLVQSAQPLPQWFPPPGFEGFQRPQMPQTATRVRRAPALE